MCYEKSSYEQETERSIVSAINQQYRTFTRPTIIVRRSVAASIHSSKCGAHVRKFIAFQHTAPASVTLTFICSPAAFRGIQSDAGSSDVILRETVYRVYFCCSAVCHRDFETNTINKAESLFKLSFCFEWNTNFQACSSVCKKHTAVCEGTWKPFFFFKCFCTAASIRPGPDRFHTCVKEQKITPLQPISSIQHVSVWGHWDHQGQPRCCCRLVSRLLCSIRCLSIQTASGTLLSPPHWPRWVLDADTLNHASLSYSTDRKHSYRLQNYEYNVAWGVFLHMCLIRSHLKDK